MSYLYKAIEAGEITFDQLNVDFDTIVHTRIYKLLDMDCRNILFMTRNDPELSLRLIKELDAEYFLDRDGVDTFEGLNEVTIKKYYELELHKYTTPPKTYFDFLVGEEIEDVVNRFKDRASGEDDLFIEHPGMLKFCSIDEFKDRKFFESVCIYPGKIFCNEMYAIEVAIYHGYVDLFPMIPNKNLLCLTSCKGWEKLDENSILYFIENSKDDDPGELLKVAFEKFYPKLIDNIFSRNKSESFYDRAKKYFTYIGEEQYVDEKTYQYLLEKYPDYRGFFGHGLLYICIRNNFSPLPTSVTKEDLEDVQFIFDNSVIFGDMNFTTEQCKFLLAQDYVYSDKFYEYCSSNENLTS